MGFFAKNLKQAIKDCEIEDTREASFRYLLQIAEEKGISPMFDPFTHQWPEPENLKEEKN